MPGKTKHLLSQHIRKSRSIVPATMVPMIDVVFLLLVFFLLVSNFRGPEAFLPADLPAQDGFSPAMELQPLHIYLHSRPDGTCHIQIDDHPGFVIERDNEESGFDLLSQQVAHILKSQNRRTSDPIKLIPTWHTRWDHVVKTYDALWKLNLNNIIFAVVDNP